MESLRKSFKSIASSSMSSTTTQHQHHEKRPILSDHDDLGSSSGSRRDLLLNIHQHNVADHNDNNKDNNDSNNNNNNNNNNNSNNNNIWRGSSYDFWRDQHNGGGGGGGGGVRTSDPNSEFEFDQQRGRRSKDKDKDKDSAGVEEEEDPPSKLIGQFLHKQRASGEVSLDMDLEMGEFFEDHHHVLPPVNESPTIRLQQQQQQLVSPAKVSFRDSRDDQISDGDGEEEEDQVVRCTSNASFQRKSGFLTRTKTTKSRLIDSQIIEPEKKSGRTPKSSQIKSGFLGKLIDDDEEDPFADDDVPGELKKANLSSLTVLQWLSLVLILAGLICSLTIKFLNKRKLWDLPLWKWELMILVLICGRLVSGWGVRLVVFFVERNFLLRKKVLYFVYGLRKAVQNCLWLGLVLIAWHYIFDKKVEREVKNKFLLYITKILICLLVGTLVWLVKTLLVKVLASSFHVSTYFDRIQESLFNQYVIETLSGPPLIEIENQREEEERVLDEVQKLQNAGAKMPSDLKATALPNPKSGKVMGSGLQRSPRIVRSFRSSGAMSKQPDDAISIDRLHKLNQKNISAWNMKRMINIVRYGVISTLDERIQDSAHDKTQIRSEAEAKAAAKKIFVNVARPRSKYICLDDLMRFMREDEAMKTMSLFEGACENNNRISKSALKNWVVNVFRERKALALTLDDTKTAVNQLHHMVNVVVAIVIVVISLLILEIATTQLLVVISSQLLLVVFMFGNTCKMVFEAIVFLFVMHPFDVGDRCEVDGVQVVVEEMNILTTVFLRFDNMKIYYPNSVLATKPISNHYRSPDTGDAIDFCIHVSTPVEKLALMKERIMRYITNKKEHWHPDPIVVVRDVEDLNRLKLSVWPTHRMNFQDMGERWVRRAMLVEEMIKIFRELDIEYRMLPFDVNFRNLPPLSTTRFPSNWTTCTS
ncbi:hypothetical protein Scep_000218 [Stephania cephalantha]|uniref:Mechanosensitive ion channel protein n=1 Tax=Stephania cephalantha TaxID=152367 RepID=A0AAP0L5N0_9MAGN